MILPIRAQEALVALMANLLALDQSSRASGWAVFEDKTLIDSGTFGFKDANIG